MTRFTKIARKRHLNATPWSELKKQRHTTESESDHEQDNVDGQNEPNLSEESTEIKLLENKFEEKKKQEMKVEEDHRQSENQNGFEEEGKQSSSSSNKRKEKMDKMKLARKLRRQKMKKCYSCRKRGHSVKDCPLISSTESNVCYHCASSQHTTKHCPHASSSQERKGNGQFSFASCFICKEKGHIARTCPQNPRGLYPDGGGCKICGSVEHFKKDCPELQTKKEKQGTIVTGWKNTSIHLSVDSLDDVEEEPERMTVKKRKKKVVKF